MTRACIALLAGVFALQLSSFSHGVVAICLVAAVLCALRCWTVLACLVAGVLLFVGHALLVVDKRIAHEFEGDSMLVVVRVADFTKVSGDTAALILQPLDDERLPPRIRASWFEPPVRPELGDVWQMELRLRRPRGAANPFVFDYETWLFRERIHAVGYVVPGKRNKRLHSRQYGLLDGIRVRLVERIVERVANPETAAVLVAITVGARHMLSAEQWQRYALTGLSHLMAISGLHIGLASIAAYFSVSFVLAAVGVRRNNHDLAVIAGLVVGCAYAALSGFAIPAQRAVIMLAITAAAFLRRRQLRASRLVSSACIAVVMIDPIGTMTPGFKLSFAAVVLLLWLGRRSQGRSGHGVTAAALMPLRTALQLGHMQLVLLLGLLPLTAIVFQRVALLAAAVNLVAVPVFSIVTVPMTLAAAMLQWDPPLLLAAASIRFIEWLAGIAAGSRLADTPVAATRGLATLLLVLPLAWVALPSGWPGRHVAWLALVSVLLWKPAAPPWGCIEITVLDVGQGQAVVLQTHRGVTLYDTGPAYRSGGSAAQRVILPFLRARGVSDIDAIVVSHGDLDHAGGLQVLQAAMPVGQVWLNEPAAAARPCRRGSGWRQDGITFSFLHPAGGAVLADNNRSCVLLVEAGRYAALLSGDIEAAAEHELIKSGLLQPVSLATVPHHGSRTSSSTPFVERVAPTFAVVSSGFGNRWGFPKPDIVERWQSQGASVLQTARSGALTFRLCQRSGIRLRAHTRELQRRIWHER